MLKRIVTLCAFILIATFTACGGGGGGGAVSSSSFAVTATGR